MKYVASNELSCPRKKASPFYCLKILMNAALRQALKTRSHIAQELGSWEEKMRLIKKTQLIHTVLFLCWKRLWYHKQEAINFLIII